ncbi:MAG: winged helix DNA-binding domain-containing protein [Thermomicrobiales bacterium]
MPRTLAPDATTLSLRALNRATLARQSLLERSDASAFDMVRHLSGMQAQAPFPPYFGLWSRLENFAPDDLSRLILDRSLVRITLMRGTVHLATAADAQLLRPLIQPTLNRLVQQNSQFRASIAGLDLDELAMFSRKLLENEPQSMLQLREHLAARWPDRDPAGLSHATYYLLPLVQIPPRGIWGMSGQPVCTTLDAWVGAAPDDDPSIDDVVLRYLGAFGPATVMDAQTWSGLTRLGAVFERLRPQLVSFRDEDGRELFDLPESPRPDPETPAPARILAPFDNVLIGYKNRRRIMTEPHQKQIFTQNGIVQSAALIDGFTVGTVATTRANGHATQTITLFEAISPRDRDELVAEGERLLAFAEPDADRHAVEFSGPD